MKQKMSIFLISFILFVSAAAVMGIFLLRQRPKEKEFSGYILWLREAVVFANGVNLNSKDGLFEMTGPIVWVEQEDTVYSLYDKAYTITTGASPYDDDDLKVIKVTFKGLYYDKDILYWGNGTYEARTRVRVTNIISYSNIIEN